MENKEYGIYKYLDVSTGHITYNDSKFLDDATSIPGAYVYKYDEGYFLALNGPDDAEKAERVTCPLSDAFWNLIDFAHSKGCILIRLDSDGMEFPEFPSFNW